MESWALRTIWKTHCLAFSKYAGSWQFSHSVPGICWLLLGLLSQSILKRLWSGIPVFQITYKGRGSIRKFEGSIDVDVLKSSQVDRLFCRVMLPASSSFWPGTPLLSGTLVYFWHCAFVTLLTTLLHSIYKALLPKIYFNNSSDNLPFFTNLTWNNSSLVWTICSLGLR